VHNVGISLVYLIFGLGLILLIAVRGIAGLLGFRLKPWLPPSGRRRYYADLLITATLLLCGAVLVGLQKSFFLAFCLVILSSLIATILETMRNRKPSD
jgi:hypothetical protein